jgi:hypothetical protein
LGFHTQHVHTMTGTRESLGAMIGEIIGKQIILRRILQTMFPLLLRLPRRNNIKEQSKWCEVDEGTLHNWHKRDLGLEDFNRRLIDGHGSGEYVVHVKRLKRCVQLLSVEYLREDGSIQAHKLYFCTDTEKDWQWILERYGIRFQIEFLFRDAKQFLGLAHCQSTHETKIENHINLALSTVSVAKAAHRLPIPKDQKGPFSMAQLKAYYHNLALFEQFSVAVGLNPTETKNNPKIKQLLLSTTYVSLAA